MTQLPEHLGGHGNRTNLDEGALDWAIQTFTPKTMLDIGCGPGGMVELAEAKGIDALGVDGDFTLKRYNPDRFVIHDFSKGGSPIDKKFDLGWSVEFVEHVYAKYIPNYMNTFQKCRNIIMTFAPPGFGGYHHVNEQEESYWINVFNSYGFKYNDEYTKGLRESSTLGKKRKAFVKYRGLVFINEKF